MHMRQDTNLHYITTMASVRRTLLKILVIFLTLNMILHILILLYVVPSRLFRNKTEETDVIGLDFPELSESLGVDPNENVTAERYFMNISRSSEIGVNRHVLDTRPDGCSSIPYATDLLPSVSVIIPFHDEPWSTLLRTVHSVLSRTPSNILEEILLVDDASNHPVLHIPLEKYLKQISKARIIRSYDRIGVIQARQLGAENARAEILAYVDSHCEVNQGWIEPLLHEIARNNKTVTGPILDYINPNTFQYNPVMNYLRGGFAWDLAFKHTDIPTSAKVGLLPMDCFSSPALLAGTFALNRKFLLSLGGFDPEMRTWGGEDVDISIKAWLCGGRMLVCPCSRVGHVYKDGHVYKIDYRDANRNIMRIAENLLGEYKKYFYAVTGGHLHPNPNENFTAFDNVKRTLKCNSFKWFIEEIFPELGIPPDDALYFGPLGTEGTCMGLHSDGDNIVQVFTCFSYRSKNVAFLKNGELRMGSYCIVPLNHSLYLKDCDNISHHKWSYLDKTLKFGDNMCINLENRRTLTFVPCRNTSNISKWEFRYKMTYTA